VQKRGTMTSTKDSDKLKEQEELNEQVVDKNKEGDTSGEEQVELTELEKIQAEHAELKDKHMRLFAEFENFRKRTQKEKLDLMKSASESVITSLLPVLDDFDRASKAWDASMSSEEIIKGQSLIQQKLISAVEMKGLKAMESSIGKDFDTDFHEAITQIPAPDDSMKGKVIDEVECGYLLNGKVIRFAKVVVGK